MRRHLAYAAALLLALTACSGDDPEPKVADPTPSASPSPSESAAPVKEEWEKKTDDGAVAFSKHWIKAFDEAKATGEVSRLDSLSDAKCVTCRNYSTLTKEIYGDGGSIESNGWTVLSVSTPSASPSSELRVSMRIEQSPQKIRRAPDAKVERYPGGESTFTAQVQWTNGRWLMRSLDVVE